MNQNKSLHFDFLLETERLSSSPLRLRFMIPVVGFLCLSAALIVWQVDYSSWNASVLSKKKTEEEIAKLKSSHEAVLKDRAEIKELSGQLEQLKYYQHSKNLVGATLAYLTNCVTSNIQLTELAIASQMPPPVNTGQAKPKTPLDLAKLCPTNTLEAVNLRFKGRYYQSGVTPVELNKFLAELKGNAFTSLVTQVNRQVDYQEDTAKNRGESKEMDIYSFEINYECLPRRFQ
jgi:hypothetical protein